MRAGFGSLSWAGRKSMIHELKTWAPYYDAAVSGEKTFEVRRDDRGFQRGDTVTLIRCVQGRSGMWEVDYDIHGQPRATATFRIGWILTGGQFGIEPGYVVFSLHHPAPAKDEPRGIGDLGLS